MIKVIIFDFDGTIINIDMLNFICGITGKEKESEELHQAYLNNHSLGVKPLITRINFLKGVTLKKLYEKLQTAPPITPGLKELIDYAKSKKIITIISSGNIIPLLEYYKKLLGIDSIVGSPVQIKDGKIVGISESDFPYKDFKMRGVQNILDEHKIGKESTAVFGDSIADLSTFGIASLKFVINPKNGFEKYGDFLISNFHEAIPIIEKLKAE